MTIGDNVGRPLANYAAFRRAGDDVFLSGIIAVDAASRHVVASYDDVPPAARVQLSSLGYATGQMSVDALEAPIVAQSCFVLDRIRELAAECGGRMSDVARLVQYFRDLRHYPAYNRMRGLFFAEPVVSTVVEVSRLLPSDDVLVEVEATLYLPRATT